MTMTVDANQQRYGHLQFDNMSSNYPASSSNQTHFSNPWSAPPASHALYAGSQVAHGGLAANHMTLDRHTQQPSPRVPVTTAAPMAPYGAVPVTSAAADLLTMNRMPHPSSAPAYHESAYTTAASPVHPTYAASPTSYDAMSYPSSAVRHNFGGLVPETDPQARRGVPDDRRSFQDALEAGHGMVNLKYDTSNQETPRAGVYNSRGRGNGDSYGFPSTHSTSSSVSSTGFSPYYGSMDGNVSDYSTAGSDIESVGSRTLPRPQGLMATQPPAPQSMMGQFSSKVSSSTQKKHKCKICEKRFTRPSSLQTHMYSHTGEKPFKCEEPNCGRNFSVVSNLRRHRKVHKGETRSEAGSEDHTQSD